MEQWFHDSKDVATVSQVQTVGNSSIFAGDASRFLFAKGSKPRDATPSFAEIPNIDTLW